MSCKKKLIILSLFNEYTLILTTQNNGTKYLLIFDDPCAEICNSKQFVDIASAGRHRGFSTIYI